MANFLVNGIGPSASILTRFLISRRDFMASEREFHETVARCVSMMVYYRNDQRSVAATAAMIDEIQEVARRIAMMGPTAGKWNRELCRRVQEELIARYGRPNGGCLHDEFRAAFEGAARVHGSSRLADGVPES